MGKDLIVKMNASYKILGQRGYQYEDQQPDIAYDCDLFLLGF